MTPTVTRSVRKILVLAACSLIAGCATVASIVYPLNENADKARAGNYSLDDDHASVVFSINHFGFSEFRGRFDTLTGSLDLDSENPQNSYVTVDVAINSLHTGVEALDQQLLAKDMFDAGTYSNATFTSDTVTRVSDDSARIDGVLTIKGISRPISLEARFIGSGTNPLSGRQTTGFTATTILKRSDFGLKNWLPFVEDEVEVVLDVEFAENR